MTRRLSIAARKPYPCYFLVTFRRPDGGEGEVVVGGEGPEDCEARFHRSDAGHLEVLRTEEVGPDAAPAAPDWTRAALARVGARLLRRMAADRGLRVAADFSAADLREALAAAMGL